jgi:hypothetical protein
MIIGRIIRSVTGNTKRYFSLDEKVRFLESEMEKLNERLTKAEIKPRDIRK